MTITRIRGGQIQDRTLDGSKIQQGSLLDEHFASNAAIQESKLNINWSSHTEALQNRKVIDYVQVNGTNVSNLSKFDATNSAIISLTSTDVLSNTSDEGIIVDAPKNQILIRDSITKGLVADSNGNEVYGRMTKDLTSGSFMVSFFSMVSGTETPFTMPSSQTIDWQYARRFNLFTVSEMFAANEKFVDGASDVTSHLNIDQLASDLYGSNFTLDRDGKPNLSTSVLQQISNESLRATNAESTLQSNINAETQARITADNSIVNDLSSNASGKGASLIGINDSNNYYTSTNVEGALAEIQSSIANINTSGSTLNSEVTATHTRDANTLNNYFTIQTFKSLEDRFNNVESTVDGKFGSLDTEIGKARGATTSLDTRLSKSLNADGTLKAGKQIHNHLKTILQISATTSYINMPSGQYFANDGTLNVYVNGILQANGINFTEVLDVSNRGIEIDFGSDQLIAGDIVILEWVVYNAQ